MLQQLAPWLGLFLLAIPIGMLGSLTGAGGGFLIVPLLLVLYPDEPVSILTSISLAVVAINATSGSVAFARFRLIDYRVGLTLAAAGIPAAVLGVMATRLIPRGTFDLVFGLLLTAFGVYLLTRTKSDEQPARPASLNAPLTVGLGSTIGLLSGLLGIGGGFLLAPLLIQVLGYPALVAAATSQFNLALTAFAGTIAHIVSGEFDHGQRRTIALGLGVLAGSQLGARLARRVRARWIVRALAVSLVLAGLRISLSFFNLP
jgi:uncharacterized membrane protein YfcA